MPDTDISRFSPVFHIVFLNENCDYMQCNIDVDLVELSTNYRDIYNI